MTQASMTQLEIKSECRSALGVAQIVGFALDEPLELTWQSDVYRIDLSLAARPANARASFTEHWAPTRFERLGTLYALPPGELLRFRSDPGTNTSIVCELAPAGVVKWLDETPAWRGRLLESALDLADPQVTRLLRRIADELRHPGFGHSAMVELLIAQLALELARGTTDRTAREAAGGLAPWRLRLIDERLRELRASPSVTELAALCGLSPRQLARGFRTSRGCSLGRHIAEVRVEAALGLLGSDESIKSIAAKLGYGTPASFAAAFRRATGTAPRTYRAQRRTRAIGQAMAGSE